MVVTLGNYGTVIRNMKKSNAIKYPYKKLFFICFTQSPFKIYDVTTWLRNNYNTHILLNISPSKGNKTAKSGHVIECNKRNIFL